MDDALAAAAGIVSTVAQAVTRTAVYTPECILLGRYTAKAALCLSQVQLQLVVDEGLRGERARGREGAVALSSSLHPLLPTACLSGPFPSSSGRPRQAAARCLWRWRRWCTRLNSCRSWSASAPRPAGPARGPWRTLSSFSHPPSSCFPPCGVRASMRAVGPTAREGMDSVGIRQHGARPGRGQEEGTRILVSPPRRRHPAPRRPGGGQQGAGAGRPAGGHCPLCRPAGAGQLYGRRAGGDCRGGADAGAGEQRAGGRRQPAQE